jgi:Flp pilus assembly protein CpaB
MSGIVVAGQNISAGTKITADMVTIKQIPLSDVVQGTFGQAADVVGKVAITDIVSGEQVVNARVLAATDAGQVIHPDALAETVPVSKQSAPCGTPNCGMRALSVSVSPTTAAAGLIRAGDRVDIVAAFQDGSAVTVVTDVEVLALDTDFQRLTGAQDSGSSGALKQGDEKVDATVATVAVWPDEVLKLAAAEDMAKKNQNCAGTLRLSLRHTNQPGTFDVPVGKGACAQAYATAWGIKVD